MRLSLETGSANRIRSYTPGHLVVNEEVIEHSAVIMPEQIVHDWPPRHFEDLSEAHMELVAAHEPEVILLGTGDAQHFPDRSLLTSLLRRGIGIEVMDTAAACRTYNILMAEDRRVAAALLI